MQAHPELITMEKADFLVILEKLNKLDAIEADIKAIKEANAKQEDESLVWRNAREVARGLNVPTKTARNLIALPNFPKNIGGKRARYKTGPWRASEVKHFFKINKSKV